MKALIEININDIDSSFDSPLTCGEIEHILNLILSSGFSHNGFNGSFEIVEIIDSNITT